jgi:hypothetical protein
MRIALPLLTLLAACESSYLVQRADLASWVSLSEQARPKTIAATRDDGAAVQLRVDHIPPGDLPEIDPLERMLLRADTLMHESRFAEAAWQLRVLEEVRKRNAADPQELAELDDAIRRLDSGAHVSLRELRVGEGLPRHVGTVTVHPINRAATAAKWLAGLGGLVTVVGAITMGVGASKGSGGQDADGPGVPALVTGGGLMCGGLVLLVAGGITALVARHGAEN